MISHALDAVRRVAEDARALDIALGRTPADRAVALDDLEATVLGWATLQDARPGFQGGEPTGDSVVEPAGDRLDDIAADLDIAEVLLSAGMATGEVDTAVDGRKVLRTSISRLEEMAADSGGGGATKGFADVPEGPTDPAAFAEISRMTVDAVVDGTHEVLKDAAARLREVVPGAVSTALMAAEAVLEAAPRVGRLVRLGLQALDRAVSALLDLVPDAVKSQVREWAGDWWAEFGASTGRAAVARLVSARLATDAVAAVDVTSVPTESLDHAGTQLRALGERFAKLVTTFGRVLRALAAAVAVAAVVATAVAAVGAWVPAAAAAGYLAAAGTVIFFARDYLDTGETLTRVDGVQRILNRLRPA